jgi:hypothetical protein
MRLRQLSAAPGMMRRMTKRTATGAFDLHGWTPTEYDEQTGAKLTKVLVQRAYHGDIDGTATAELIMVAVPVEGSDEYQGVAYVGVERITGSVHGRKGNFVITHTADIANGMTVPVVAGSGTDELRGITGQLTIERADDGTHTYTFEYELD